MQNLANDELLNEGALREDVLRELHYVAAAGPATRFLNGQVARAQDAALARGWLAPDALHRRLLVITPRGLAILVAASVEQR